jgi:phosphoribosyl 1,2-cyclic phosphate phosphodiesterase
MELILLGSGGVSPAPRPTCACRICSEARLKGIPYARTGSSMFIKDIDVLFDTPEEIRQQINREGIDKITSIILTHWHPDHTHGLRVIEQFNWDFDQKKTHFGPVNVYMSARQQELFKKMTCGSFLDFYEKKGMIKVVNLEHKQKITINSISITPYLIQATEGFYFLIESAGKKAIYASCEYHHFIPDESIKGVDVFIVHNLFWENKAVSPRLNNPTDEDSFEDMLSHAETFEAKKIILTHIEESFGLNHDELNEQMKKFYPDSDISAGFDGQIIKL